MRYALRKDGSPDRRRRLCKSHSIAGQSLTKSRQMHSSVTITLQVGLFTNSDPMKSRQL